MSLSLTFNFDVNCTQKRGNLLYDYNPFYNQFFFAKGILESNKLNNDFFARYRARFE